jgi:hypothetical protein
MCNVSMEIPAQAIATVTASIVAAGAAVWAAVMSTRNNRALKSHEIMFGRLHDDRVRVMVEIYDKLFDLRQDVWQYLKLMRNITEDVAKQREEGYVKLRKQMDATHSYYRRRRFYFDKAMCERMDGVFTTHYKIEEIIHPHHTSEVLINVMAVETEARKSMREDLDGAFTILHDQMKLAMDALENGMRRLLGVEVEAKATR